MNKPLKILSLPVDRGGCGWYRVRQPFAMIDRMEGHQAHIIDKDEDNMIQIAEALSQADIIVIRQGGEVGIEMLRDTVIRYGQEIGKPRKITAKIVLDIDDNIELISPYSEHYRDYGTEEHFDKNIGKWIWKDGEEGFDVMRNRKKVDSLLNAMRSADLVSVTTEKLAEYARGYNKSVVVLPNSIDAEKWWPLDFAPHKQLRIGWSGGVSHYEDWYSIKKPLNKMLRKYRFKLISVGSHFPGVVDEDLRDLVEVHPWVPFQAHSYHMMAMALDIAIIPLADLPFNYYKSSIKFEEMSAMGIPSLVADVTPYKEEIRPANGLTYRNPVDFEENLSALIENESLRKTIGEVARKTQLRKFDAKKNAQLYINAYSSIL